MAAVYRGVSIRVPYIEMYLSMTCMNMGALHRDVSIYDMYEDACLTYRQPYVYICR